MLEVNPDFLEIAASLDAERAAGTVRSNLHGIPFMIKDNVRQIRQCSVVYCVLRILLDC